MLTNRRSRLSDRFNSQIPDHIEGFDPSRPAIRGEFVPHVGERVIVLDLNICKDSNGELHLIKSSPSKEVEK
jgi:hypothetical protein